MDGVYIAKRLLPEFVKNACTEQHIQFASFSDDWVLKLQNDQSTAWVVGYGFSLNNAASDRLANDKVGQYLALAGENIPCVEHYLAKSLASSQILYDKLAHLNPTDQYVTKPLSSSGGRGIQLYKNLTEALGAIDNGLREEWSVSPFHDIVAEKRLIVLNGNVILTYEKQNPTERDGLRMFNLGLGATPKDCKPTEFEQTLALQVASVCGLKLCAVDIVTLANGEQKVIEVNSGIMMEYYARYSRVNYETAQEIYRQIISATFS